MIDHVDYVFVQSGCNDQSPFFMSSYLLSMCSYLLFICSYRYLPVLKNAMFACICVIVGFKSFM